MAFSNLYFRTLISNPSNKSIEELWPILNYTNLTDYATKAKVTNKSYPTLYDLYETVEKGTPIFLYGSASCRDSIVATMRKWADTIVPWISASPSRAGAKVVAKMDKTSFDKEYFNQVLKYSGFSGVWLKDNEFGFYLKNFDIIKFSLFEMLLRSTDFISKEVISDKDKLISTMLENTKRCLPNNSDHASLTIGLAFGIYTSGYTYNNPFTGNSYNISTGGVSFHPINGASSGMSLYAMTHLADFLDFLIKFKVNSQVLDGFPFPFAPVKGPRKFKRWEDLITYYNSGKPVKGANFPEEDFDVLEDEDEDDYDEDEDWDD